MAQVERAQNDTDAAARTRVLVVDDEESIVDMVSTAL
jgi:hypothetical protein